MGSSCPNLITLQFHQEKREKSLVQGGQTLVSIPHLVWRNGDLVPVLIGSFGRNFIHIGYAGAVIVEDPELRQVIRAH